MNTYDLNKLSDDDKIYYSVVLNKITGEYFMIKNYSCTAHIKNFLEDKYKLTPSQVWRIFVIFDNRTEEKINLNNIYKKYHKYFKEIA